jgi:hypothetical protein
MFIFSIRRESFYIRCWEILSITNNTVVVFYAGENMSIVFLVFSVTLQNFEKCQLYFLISWMSLCDINGWNIIIWSLFTFYLLPFTDRGICICVCLVLEEGISTVYRLSSETFSLAYYSMKVNNLNVKTVLFVYLNKIILNSLGNCKRLTFWRK